MALLEALSNAVIHGNGDNSCKSVYVTCRCYMDGEVAITVRDEGRGPRFESRDRSPVAIDQSSPYYWKTTPVGDSAQLLTLFCRACGVSKDSEEDVPLVSVLRNTLGDQSGESDCAEWNRVVARERRTTYGLD
jgi:hypothetical protein